MKVEREFLTNFLILGFAKELTNTEFSRNSRLNKSTLVHGFTQRDYSLGKDNHFDYMSGEKKIGVN